MDIQCEFDFDYDDMSSNFGKGIRIQQKTIKE